MLNKEEIVDFKILKYRFNSFKRRKFLYNVNSKININ